jgi:hypothetical protein
MQRFYPFLFVFLWSTGFIGAKYGLPYAEPAQLPAHPLRLGHRPDDGDGGAGNPRAVAGKSRSSGCTSGFPVCWSMRSTWAAFLSPSSTACRPGITALVVGMQPLLTAFGAGWLLGEKVSGRQWAGLALGFVGVGLVVSGKLGDQARSGRCWSRP